MQRRSLRNAPAFRALMVAALTVAAGVVLPACTNTSADPALPVVTVSDDALPTRQQLYDRFFASRRLLLVYGTAEPASEETFRQMAGRSSGRWRATVDAKRADTVLSADLEETAVMLVGTPASNAELRRLAPNLPVTFDDAGFEFAGVRYDDPTDVLSLVFPNPDNVAFPLFLVTGNDDASIAAYGEGMVRMYDYQVLRAGKRVRLGHFAQEEGRRWAFDRERDFDLLHTHARLAENAAFSVYAAPDVLPSADIDRLLAERGAARERLAALLGPDRPLPSVAFHLYPSIQQKALVTDDMRRAHADFDAGEVHVAIQHSTDIHGDSDGMELALLLRRALGKPPAQALEDGLRIVLAGNWHGQDVRLWAGRIQQAGLAPSLDVLLDDDRYEAYPALLREPVAAELAALLLATEPRWIDTYTNWTPGSAPARAALERNLTNRLAEAANRTAGDAGRPRGARPYPRFYKGFNFAHEGYGIINGYGSQSAVEALAHTVKMGANAVSVIPYTFIRDATSPQGLPIPTSAGSENDDAVLHAALEARRLGLHVTVKPQIWVRGGWPGDIEMGSEADWETFFQSYERWIGHYAVMAELYGLDMLCVGTELSKATLTHPDRWVAMTASWRHLFTGSVVYASNWGEEFENLTFWDAFDYIAVNSYYPLSEEEAPSDRDLLRGARAAIKRMETVHRRFGKPIIITETGFASTAKPWKQPWLDNRDAGLSMEGQARCYEAVCRAIDGNAWLRGVYWWKWPSYLSRGGPEQRGFTPNGKPAADVVAEWFGNW